jgi:hypothetical protein
MIRSIPILALSFAFGAIAGPLAAYAQSSPGPAGSNQVIPEKIQPQSQAQSGSTSSSNLSSKLSRTNGVIKPPAGVDPKINRQAPAPHPNSMPVIHPPGTLGGQGDVQPK